MVVVVVVVVSTFDEVMVLAEVMAVVSTSNTGIFWVVNLSLSLFVVVISSLGLIFSEL